MIWKWTVLDYAAQKSGSVFFSFAFSAWHSFKYIKYKKSVPTSQETEAILPLALCLHGMVFN
jgi:hypothetical protein